MKEKTAILAPDEGQRLIPFTRGIDTSLMQGRVKWMPSNTRDRQSY